jgi:hypothetical protein
MSGFSAAFDTSRAVQNYRKFLELCSMQNHNNKESFKLVPTYEIDLMWHTHITGGSMFQYHSDCQAVEITLSDFLVPSYS